MPLFLSDEDFTLCSSDALTVAERADAFITNLYKQLDTIKVQADASAITAEQTCSLLEQRFISLSSDFSDLQSKNTQLLLTLDQRDSEIAQVQAEKHQLNLQSIEKDRVVEQLSVEVSALHDSKRQLIELIEQKNLEISEKNSSIRGYLDKIVNLTNNSATREVQYDNMESELSRTRASCDRLSDEKELIKKHNDWLNDELTSKVNSLVLLRKTHAEFEADMSVKLAEVERQFDECSSSLRWNQEKVRDLESTISSLQEELCSSKSAAAASEEQFSIEISTVNKLVELYKESSEEWSKKASELEGVIKALEAHLSQIESDYKDRLEKEERAKLELEKDVHDLKEKLERSECALEANQKSNEHSLVQVCTFNPDVYLAPHETIGMTDDTQMLVPNITRGVSGTALAASLLREGWSLAKMYGKYQETFDALRHEQLGRKQAEAILERVLYEIEEKAGIIMDERAEHERMVNAYSLLNEKFENSVSEHSKLQRIIHDHEVDLRRQEHKFTMTQKVIGDLKRQITVLLKECRDIQVRCGAAGYDYSEDEIIIPACEEIDESEADEIISVGLLTFTDINGLVEKNVQLRSHVRSLTDQIKNKDFELKQKFEVELQKHVDDAISKVAAVLEKSEEQGRMLVSLHNSVAMYKRLYEEERKLRTSNLNSVETTNDSVSVGGIGRSNLMIPDGPQENRKNIGEQTSERLRSLEDDLLKSRNEIISLRMELDKKALEASFVQGKLDSLLKDSIHQRDESHKILAKNVEFSQLIVEYQQKLREHCESVHAAEELSRKLTMEVSVLKSEKELLLKSEQRACDEIHGLTDRVCRLQTSLDTIQVAKEILEDTKSIERRKQEEHIKEIEREWADAKMELQEERNSVRSLTHDKEYTIKNAMRQIEDMGKDLSSALRAVTAAEVRAAVSEAKNADLEKMVKSVSTKMNDIEGDPSTSLVSEADHGLHALRDELEKLKLEAKANMDHMLQYKNIAQVNEDALKHMECAHEDFKAETEKLKMSLETEISSLRQRVLELEEESRLMSQDAATAVSGKEEALTLAFAEVTALKEERSVKMSQVLALELKVSALNEDLEEEHQRWQTAKDNYERQVILQSETIQELTKTSKVLASLQEEASELRRVLEAEKNKFNELKAIWDDEKYVLEKSKIDAELKYNDINEQNQLLHSRLDSWHIKLVAKDHTSQLLSESSSPDAVGDCGLQSVVKHLRRNREIAETELSMLRQEKHRLQFQLESALKAAEAARASLTTERENSKAWLFSEDEIKSLQSQVMEINLLRESNMHLRDENKRNFEECQKLHDVAQKNKLHVEKLEMLLKDGEVNVGTCKKEIEMLRIEKDRLERHIAELSDRFKNIDIQEYDRMKHEIQEMQECLRQKDAQIDELKKLIFDKESTISQLEHELANIRLELCARENKINDILQVESDLRLNLEKQQKMLAPLKKKADTLSREKDELIKEKQNLSKQLEDSKPGKRTLGDALGDRALKDKQKEKEARIQMLEKTLERHKKEKIDLQREKIIRQKNETAIAERCETVIQEKKKLNDEFEKHKQAVKKLSDEVEKLLQAKAKLPEGCSAVQHLSKSPLDDIFASYVLAVENFETLAHSVFKNFGASNLTESPALGTTSASIPTPGHLASAPSMRGSPPRHLEAKTIEETVRRPIQPKAGRKLIRPRLKKSVETPNDVEMSEVDASAISKPALLVPETDIPTQPPSLRKRPASSSSSQLDLQEESLKKCRAESPTNEERQEKENHPEEKETSPTEGRGDDVVADLPSNNLPSNDDAGEGEKNEAMEATESSQVEDQTLDAAAEPELENSGAATNTDVLELDPEKTDEKEIPIPIPIPSVDEAEAKEARAEEVIPEMDCEKEDAETVVEGDDEGAENQEYYVTTPASPPEVDDEAVASEDEGDDADQVVSIEDAPSGTQDAATGAGAQDAPSGTQEDTATDAPSGAQDAAAASQDAPASNTINIEERARQKRSSRLAGVRDANL